MRVCWGLGRGGGDLALPSLPGNTQLQPWRRDGVVKTHSPPMCEGGRKFSVGRSVCRHLLHSLTKATGTESAGARWGHRGFASATGPVPAVAEVRRGPCVTRVAVSDCVSVSTSRQGRAVTCKHERGWSRVPAPFLP